MKSKALIIGLLVAVALFVPLKMADAARYQLTPEQKAWYEKIIQDYLDSAMDVYIKYYGEKQAKRVINRLIRTYKRYYGLELVNPFDTVDKTALIEEYNKKLQDLANYLKGEGMSADLVQEKVEQTKAYYEEQYGITLTLPDFSQEGKSITLSREKQDKTAGKVFVKNSIRRLGGIITNERPVSTYIGDDYRVKAGFLQGVSIFDRKLLFRPPVGFPERHKPKKIAVITKEVVQ